MAAHSLPLRVDRGSLPGHRGGSESIHLGECVACAPGRC